MYFHTVIIGAGPGGLACARILAEHGITPLVIERKENIGDKVCAGGITWGGLISRVPAQLAEKSFPVQHIITRLQNISIQEPTPIIATVNRITLGEYMAKLARQAGAEIITGWRLKEINGQSLTIKQKDGGRLQEVRFEYLVGADGSNSRVRKHIGITSKEMGIGINYQIGADLQKMEWHVSNRHFKNGYGWIFPHKNTVSIGAYSPQIKTSAKDLKTGLLAWAKTQGFSLESEHARADCINYDYQGWRFGRTFLVGDAAGLASGLTGEGIYPAIVSGEEAARSILDLDYKSIIMQDLLRKHRLHKRMAGWTGSSPVFNAITGELVTLGLRFGVIGFNKLEMAN